MILSRSWLLTVRFAILLVMLRMGHRCRLSFVFSLVRSWQPDCYHLRLPDPLPTEKCEKQLLLATQTAEMEILGSRFLSQPCLDLGAWSNVTRRGGVQER